VVRAYQEAAAEVIQQYEGHIAQYRGDGLLVYIGYPAAHENEARRAVHTGLGIVQAITTLNTRLTAQYAVELAVRLGVHTGPVVVGMMGGGGRHEHLALGETPNLAARLQNLAPANAVVLSAVTARLVQGTFALEDLGTHALPGIAEPMAVSRVRALLATPSHDEEFVAAGAPLLVGRDEEIGLLRRRWEQSKAGLGQVVLISGEAGIGKSTLVAWLAAEAVRQPALVAWEDLHWADPTTLELLGLVFEQAPTSPMLHVLTYRPEFSPPWPARSHMTPLVLNRLERPQVEALITLRAGGKTLPAEVVQYIVAKTDGVPLYVEELTKMLLASALLREEAGQYVLTGPLLAVAIPDTLQDTLMARLDQLNRAKEVAQLGDGMPNLRRTFRLPA
jgi:Adenylate and Guanylate cyclase catalytic domain/AAA ATPase domain